MLELAIEGVAVAVIGGFMALAPRAANELHERIPIIRSGGRLGQFFGSVMMVVGIAEIVIWCVNALLPL